jgi:hypothetical protein
MTKLYISSFNARPDYDFCDNYHKHYFKNFLDNGWKCLNKDDILAEPSLQVYLSNRNITPSVLYFVNANIIIQQNIKYLEKLDCVKCVFIEDINKVSGRIRQLRRLIAEVFTYIFCPYTYCIDIYNLDIPKEKIYSMPHCAINYLKVEYQRVPKYNKILLSGIVDKNIFPARYKMLELQHKYPNFIDYLEHPTYKWNKHTYIGYNYYKYLNNYLCCFTCCGNENTPFLCQKFFEIPFAGSLLFCYDKYVKEELQRLGFIDMVNYIGCDETNMAERILYIFNPENYNELRKIRLCGHYLVKNRHTSLNRINQINSVIKSNIKHKIFISSFNDCDDYKYDDITFKNYYKDFLDSGWICIRKSEIYKYENLEKFFQANNYNPTIIYFCFCNTLINQNLHYIRQLSIIKCIYIDDLHHNSSRITNMYNEIFTDFNYVFSSYGYCFSKFYPNVNLNKVIWLPHCAISSINISYNLAPKRRILLTGNTDSKIYPMRAKMVNLAKKYKIDVLKHPGYKYDKHNFIGSKYYEYIGEYLCSFVCCSNQNTPYLVKKYFEIPYSGALLLSYDKYIKQQLEQLGFVDMVNYISCDEHNLISKIEFILDPKNAEIVEKIRKSGYDLIHSSHTSKERVKFIDDILSSPK